MLTYDFFSIPFLLKTLFAPWKRDVVEPGTPNLQLLFQAFWMNLVVRLLGAFIRGAVIIAGAGALVFVMGAGGVVILAALGLPLAWLLGLVGGIALATSGQMILVGTGLLAIAITLASGLVAIKAWLKDRSFDPTPPRPLAEVSPRGINPSQWFSTKTRLLFQKIANLTEIKQGLLDYQEIYFLLQRSDISPQEFVRVPFPDEVSLNKLVGLALTIAQEEKHTHILLSDIWVAVCLLDPSLEPVLIEKDLTKTDLYNLNAWQTRIWQLVNAPSPLLEPAKLRFSGGIGKDWTSGYTNFLNRFSRELNVIGMSSGLEHMFLAHAGKIQEIERVLSRSNQHNALLVGEPGTGRETTILGFIRQIVSGRTLVPLRYKRIIELDVTALLATAHSPEELESELIAVLNEAVTAGNVIVYIPDIERLLLGSSDSVGTVNVAQTLAPYLNSPNLQLLGTITPANFHTAVEQQPSMAQAFEKIEILEPTENDTIRILQEVAPGIEARYHVLITYQAIKSIVSLANRYLPDRKFPEKGISLLDETAVDVSTQSASAPAGPPRLGETGRDGSQKGVVTPEAVEKLLTQKTNVPIGEAQTNEKEVLLNLEDLMHKRVVNQTTAIAAIANALRRSRSGISNTKKPVGSFLFLGPTGVGKTETAKALSSLYFGSDPSHQGEADAKEHMIRLDMSEFQEQESIRRLLGDDSNQTSGRLTDAIREKPFTCLLLDEIEKAHPQILDIFLQILDEGRVTDALGQQADFRNAIIIATSNAGAGWLRNRIMNYEAGIKGRGSDNKSHTTNIDMEKIGKELIEEVQNENIFRPEFLNRFDSVVPFRPLTEAELSQVVDLQVTQLNIRLHDKQITVTVTPGARLGLARRGFDPVFGARALSRTMTEVVENKIAEALLKGVLKKGQTFEVTEEMLQ